MSPAARGRRVRERLKVLGWSNKQLTEQTGISASQLSKMLAGRAGGTIETEDAWRIARALGLTQAYILWGDRSGLPPEMLGSLPPEEE